MQTQHGDATQAAMVYAYRLRWYAHAMVPEKHEVPDEQAKVWSTQDFVYAWYADLSF